MGVLLDALAWLRCHVVTAPLMYLWTMVMGTTSLALSLVNGSGGLQHACARRWGRGVLRIARIRVTVRGAEQIPPGRACIYAANHQSYMDIPLAFGYIPADFRIMAKASLFRIPFLGWHLRSSGHLPIARDNPRRAARSLLEAATHVRQGTPVFIFPEGTRSVDGSLGEFRAGTFLLAIKSGAPVVPITLNGTRRILPVGSWFLRPGRVEVIFHAPIPTTGLHADSAEDLAGRVRAAIAADFQT